MTNEYQSPEFSSSKLIRDEYSMFGYELRWQYYKHADDGTDFHQDVVDHLGLQGDEAVLDMGCGAGHVLADIETRMRHKGELVGLDYSDNLRYSRHRDRIKYVCASANTADANNKTLLPFRDDSFDVALALLMLYHTDRPEETVREMSRITRPLGKIAIATSGANNKPIHRYYESMITECIGAPKPPRYAKPFTSHIADVLLRNIFSGVDRIDEVKTITFNLEDLEQDLLDLNTKIGALTTSILSLNRYYGSGGTTAIIEAMKTVVIPHMRQRILESGELHDYTHRSLFICRNELIT